MAVGKAGDARQGWPGSGGDFLFALLEERMRSVAEQVVISLGDRRDPGRQAAGDVLDEKARLAVQEQVLIANKTYLTRADAAKYLDVSQRSIAEWSARAPDQNPLPVSYAGGEPRYRRVALDEWTEAEARRQRLKLVG